jgi:hypothetical protein
VRCKSERQMALVSALCGYLEAGNVARLDHDPFVA